MIDDPIDEPATSQCDGVLSIDQRLGLRIRSRRRERGISIAHAARSIGGAQQRIEAIESGACRPTALELAGLATALDVEVGYFFDGLTDERAPRPDDGLASVVNFPTKAS